MEARNQLGLIIAAISFVAVPGCTTEIVEETNNLEINNQQLTSANSALTTDLELVAKAKGWTIEEAAADREAADAVGRVAEEIAKNRPDIFVGSKVSPIPGASPTLYLKGPADDFVRSLVADEKSVVEIKIADNQPFSFKELEERQHRIFRALHDQGILAGAGFQLDGGGLVEVTVAKPKDIGDEEYKAAVMEVVPDDLRQDVAVDIGDESMFKDESVFGGMEALDDGSFECTTGWAVTDGVYEGVTTAGHCNGINQVVNPASGTQSVSHRSQHIGAWGDVEWKRETDQYYYQPDDFYATSFSIRDVQSVEAIANISIGESICFYGRSSDDRDCSLDVHSVSYSCLSANRLVQMDGDVTIGGDSGGGWSFNYKAYGGHKGDCASKNVFSVADYFDEAIGVSVMY